ncbi:MAG: ATP-binding protein [Bacteroidota bacterium]
MKSFIRSLFYNQIDPLSDYESILGKVLRWILIVLLVIGIPAVTMGVVEAVKLDRPLTALLYVVFFLPLIGVAIFQKHLNYKLSAAIVFFCLYLLAVHNTTVFGFSGAGLPIFLTFFILVTIFYGRKAGIIAIIAGLAALGVIGYLMVQGILSVYVDLMHISTLPISWITATSVLFLLGTLMVLGYSFIQENFLRVTRISRDQAEELRKMNENLKKEIQHKEEIQEQLKEAKEKAEESDRLKSAFLKNMSHEIRTPMNGIMGFASLLENNQLEGEKVDEYVHLIKESGNRMLEMINNLLDIAMIESGEVKIQNKETSLNPMIDDLYALFAPEAKKKGVSMRCEKSLDDHDDHMVTDGNKIKKILTNLINNAIKYTNEGQITFGYKKENSYFRFYVMDTGIGVSPELQQKIFERFRQAELEVTSNYEGAGLGLSISRALAEMLGGNMWLDSTPGEGSTFNFTIPYRSPDEHTKQRNKTAGSIKQELPEDLNLLVAEDDETSYMLIREIMDNAGITFLRAKNGKEAVEKINGHTEVDMVLMDIKMPVMDGYEATRAIKQARPELPVIVQTAYYSEEDRKKAIKAGCDAYVTKPIDGDELIGCILRIMKSGNANS